MLDINEDKLLNEHMAEEEKRVPFSRMIYIGDGMTDVPCMKLTKENGGHSIGIYHDDSAVAEGLLRYDRVDYIVPADYREGSEIERTVFRLIDRMAEDLQEEEHE